MNRIYSIAIVGCISALMVGCGAKHEQAQEAERVENVKVSTLRMSKIARNIELSATLEGYESMNIAPSVTGKIEHICVEVGTRVNNGDMLVRMDQTQLNTAKLTYANLGVEYERIKSLRETETVSQQAYDQIKLSYDQAKENLDFLTENTFVKARLKGVIAAKNYEDGELYAGNPILVLTQIAQLKALISIPESYFPQVKKGMRLGITSDIYPGQTFPATIEVVYPTIDERTHSFQVKLVIPNAKEMLRPGMYVRTTLELGEVNAIMAPYQAVLKLTGSNERYVFINDNGIARRKSVKLGQRFDEMIEIISNGIKEGDQIVVVGQARLIDGVKLNVVK
ncbi:MAG: efflux RND transporter periplasmic adaptor subunit [Bacteroidales bacterium]|nr:efflux RND transporter periplasmic adaptor subunit [Bacteroidales bacterium]